MKNFGKALLMLLTGAVLAGCSRTYTVGKNPSAEAITSVSLRHGGMTADSAWNYYACRSSGGLYLEYSFWSYEEAQQVTVKADMTEEEWQQVLQIIDGMRIRKKKTDQMVMDGESSSLYIDWPDGPGGNYAAVYSPEQWRQLIEVFSGIVQRNGES